jgi:hypothetical protein
MLGYSTTADSSSTPPPALPPLLLQVDGGRVPQRDLAVIDDGR